jgi:predicted deacylase
VEMGVGNRISKSYCKQLFEGILNLLKEVGVFKGNTLPVKEPIVSKEGEVTFISAKDSGLFVPNIENLGEIKAGDYIGDIIEPIEGRILQHLESPVDGIIFTIREHPVVYKGALLCRIYHKD